MNKIIKDFCKLIKNAATTEEKFALFYVFSFMDMATKSANVNYFEFKEYEELTGLGEQIYEFYEEIRSRRKPCLDFMSYETALAFATGNPVDVHGDFAVKLTYKEAVARKEWEKSHEYNKDSPSSRFNASCRFCYPLVILVDGLIVLNERCPYGDPYKTVLSEKTREKLHGILSHPKLKRYWDENFAENEKYAADQLANDTAMKTRPLTNADEEEIDKLLKDLGIDLDKYFYRGSNWENYIEKIQEAPEIGSLFHQVEIALKEGSFVDRDLIEAYREIYPKR
jgi:hypothetical protein